MRWKGTKNPSVGDRRKIRRFAYIPVKLDNKDWIWLESYISEQIYNSWYSAFESGVGWCDKSFYQESEDVC